MRTALLAAALLLPACSAATTGARPARATFSRPDDLKRAVLGASADEARERLGAPDAIDSRPAADAALWHYANVPGVGAVRLAVTNGRVSGVYFGRLD